MYYNGFRFGYGALVQDASPSQYEAPVHFTAHDILRHLAANPIWYYTSIFAAPRTWSSREHKKTSAWLQVGIKPISTHRVRNKLFVDMQRLTSDRHIPPNSFESCLNPDLE